MGLADLDPGVAIIPRVRPDIRSPRSRPAHKSRSPLRPRSFEKSQRLCFETSVADRPVVILAWNGIGTRARNELREIFRRPADHIGIADSDEHGHRDFTAISAEIGARDDRMQAASALRSLFVCSANARNVRAAGFVTSSMLGLRARARSDRSPPCRAPC